VGAGRVSHPLGQIGVRRFLREHWQRRPLLVRQALPGFAPPLSPDELAGLALEDEVESRIVLERGRRGPWELRNGPFTAADFARLPKTRWTLLVQAVDQWVPEVHALRAHFDFLPAWRFDDIMISYAPDQGGVGPHFDRYDVFLLQGLGRRRWRIGPACTDATPCRSDTSLRILREFETLEEHVLEPGDMLYIPPGVAHWGIAEGECMTFSLGFRAPSHAEILVDLANGAAERLEEGRRYADPPLRPRAQDGEIPAAALKHVQRVLRELAGDTELQREWFGRYMTQRKYPELDITPDSVPADLRAWLKGGGVLDRHPASRFAWSGTGPFALFVDGEMLACDDGALARLLSSDRPLDARALAGALRRKAGRELLAALVARGALCCPGGVAPAGRYCATRAAMPPV
jgi:50S ribosomal protein L16 3-hydroxylase